MKRRRASRSRSGALLSALAALALAAAPPAGAKPAAPDGPAAAVRILAFPYRAHDGLRRLAWLVLPWSYRPGRDRPLPLVVSPHGRGTSARANVETWGDLPARGRFALVAPEGQGRRLPLDSWGDPGQIADLARMPRLVERAFPRVRIARRRVYAVGASMGGQETLLLVATHPRLLAGAAAFDAPTDMALRYRDFALLRRGRRLRALARDEIGGVPWRVRRRYEQRSPAGDAAALARSGVPIQLWWSVRDRIVVDEAGQCGRLYRAIRRLDPRAPVVEFVGRWAHTAELRAKLPVALARFGLIRRH